MFVHDADPTTIKMKLRFGWKKALGMQAEIDRHDFTEKRLIQDMREILKEYDELKKRLEGYADAMANAAVPR